MISINGWIKLHRVFTEWEWYKKSEMVHLFIHLLMKSNHSDRPWQGIIVKRGQCITGLESLHRDTGISNRTIRTCLSRFEKSGEIDKQTTNKFTIITLVNYDTYQLEGKEESEKRQTNDKQTTTNKNDKNDKKNKKKEGGDKSPKSKNFQKPTIKELQDYALSIQFRAFSPGKFLDHYESNGWKVGKTSMKCWKATVRNWKRSDNSQNQQAKSLEDIRIEKMKQNRGK